ncbi:tetrathionate reductase subunit A [Pyrobaculum sp.]|uniref:tetrathionate reductase subunit A n=1 Tax=Pyrobaculum sp. TaxID=2004705 RepID=UPI00317470BB
MTSRRTYLKAVAAAAALGVALGGYWPVIDKIIKPKRTSYGPDPQFGKNVRYVHSSCLGCNVRCGIRARVVKYGDVEVIERIEGNPYHVYNRAVSIDKQVERYAPLPYNTPVKEALEKWSGKLCPRGVDGIHYVYDPYRVLKPLKRAGPRGSGKWKVITWEQLINEVVNGGVIEETGERLPGLRDFFVYGKLKEAGFEDPNAVLSEMKKDVDNIMKVAKDPGKTYDDLVKAIEEFKAKWSQRLGERGLKLEDILIDPDRPDLGTKANMVVYLRGRGQGHTDEFSQRWTYAFGSVNWTRHTSACQLGYYAGNRIWAGYTDIQADPIGARVIIGAGWSMGRLHPGATGQGVLIERACKGELKLYYVNPVAPRTICNGNIVWVPVKSGEDTALAFAVIRWLIENKHYNEEFLSIPNRDSAKKFGYPVNTNATWLVITEGGRSGEFLKAKDVGIENSEKPVIWTGEKFATYDSVDKADLYYVGKVTLPTGETVTVKTAFMILRDEAFSKTFEDWLAVASPYERGTPEFEDYVRKVEEMAKDFADAAPSAGTYIHRGAGMHPNGEYIVWAYRMIDTLVGNFHRKGGLLGRASTTSFNNYVYNVGPSGFGEPVRWGPPIDRHGYKYEDTLEYWLRIKKAVKEGKSGEEAVKAAFPTKRPWYPHTPEESYTEIFAGIEEGYPYKIGALILFYANPVLSANYGVKFVEVLKDPAKIPLYIAITTTIDETKMYADYIVPDTTYLETGTMGIQYLYASSAGVLLAEAWRSPVIMPLTQRISDCPNGHPRYASFWEFFIDTAKALGMPGFGDRAIPGVKGKKYEGRWFSIHCEWEYILRVFANAALDAKDRGLIPGQVPDEEVKFVEENYPIAQFKDILPQDEWRYVAYGLARGGVFTSYEESFDQRGVSKRSVPGSGTLYLWNEDVAKTRNSVTGEKFWGGPKYFPVATYAPVGSALQKTDKSLYGTPLRQLFPEGEWPFMLVFYTGPLYTKHRSQFYYWIKQVAPENFVVIHPEDAAKIGIETGDMVRVETPVGIFEAPAVVEPTVAPGVIMVPYGMGRWADTVVVKPKYFELRDTKLKLTIDGLPDKMEVPEDAVNPVKGLPDVVKKILFTKSPAEYYEKGLAPDKWRFNGVTPNVVQMSDPSLGGWPLLSWLGASQTYFDTPARITKTGQKHKFETPYIVW